MSRLHRFTLILVLIAGAMGLVCLAPSEAQTFQFFLSGNDLKASCGSTSGTVYVLGLVDGARLQEQTGGRRYFCLPDAATGQQLKDVVCQYIDQHPADRHRPAPYLAIAALGDTFPCGDRP